MLLPQVGEKQIFMHNEMLSLQLHPYKKQK